MRKFLVYMMMILTGFQIGLIFHGTVNAASEVTQSDMLVGKKTDLFDIGKDNVDLSLGVEDPEDVSFKDNFLRTIQKYIFGIVGMVAVTMFIYIGFELATAEGKSDQFTKALKALIYVAVGLAVIPLAYIAVKVATGFNF